MPHIKSLTLLALGGLIGLGSSQALWADDALPIGRNQVAAIGTERITFDQLPDKTRSDISDLRRRVERQKRQLDLDFARARQKIVETQAGDFLDQQVLNKEARATGKSTDQLLAQLTSPAIGEAEVRDFYAKHQQQIGKPYSEISVQILVFLTQQAADQAKRQYLDSLREKYSARLTVEPLRETVAATGPSRGAKRAVVTIVEFADFQCPYCGQMAPVLKQILERYPDDVRLVYRQLPLNNIHANAMHAAEASVCAGAQGKFWEMHDALFANQAALALEDLSKTAEGLKLDSAAFNTCMGSSATAALIDADVRAGEDAGIDGTPGMFVNGRFYNGALPYEQIAAIVEDELHRQNKPVPKS